MKIIDKFLSLKLLKYCSYKKNNFAKEKHPGITNLSWCDHLRNSSSSSLIFIMPFDEIVDCVKEEFVKINKCFEDKKFGVQMCVWFRGSSIPKHNDFNYFAAATIYLNKRWKEDNGGLFLFENKKNGFYTSITPKYNRCVINYQHEQHLVTPVSFNINEPRITLQVWIEESKKLEEKNKKFSYI